MFNWKEPHRRFNPLTGEWVLVSPHRSERPWQGQVEKPAIPQALPYDPTCYLCPGNPRAGGVRNPAYTSTFVFDNDFPALLPNAAPASFNESGLLRAESEGGICRVICFSPRHDLSIPRMDVDAIATVVETWCDQYQVLGALPGIDHVQIFENRGEMMGASNPHPHCQVWANHSRPPEVAKETAAQVDYQHKKGSCLLCDYAELERGSERAVCQNEAFAVVVPFWAVWPFETMVIARRHVTGMDELTRSDRVALADILKQVTVRYDNLFGIPFPYTMGFHQRPAVPAANAAWHLHAHYYPPLLRSAAIRKFMVGYEMLAGPQRDITPESAAARLRVMPSTL